MALRLPKAIHRAGFLLDKYKTTERSDIEFRATFVLTIVAGTSAVARAILMAIREVLKPTRKGTHCLDQGDWYKRRREGYVLQKWRVFKRHAWDSRTKMPHQVGTQCTVLGFASDGQKSYARIRFELNQGHEQKTGWKVIRSCIRPDVVQDKMPPLGDPAKELHFQSETGMGIISLQHQATPQGWKTFLSPTKSVQAVSSTSEQ